MKEFNKQEKQLINELKQENKKTKEEKEIDTIEKNKKLENEKQVQRDNLTLVEEELERCFKSCFDSNPLDVAYNHLNLIKTRLDILDHIPESESEYKHCNEIYDKVLQKVLKLYVNDAKAKIAMARPELEAREKQKKEEQEKQEKKEAIIRTTTNGLLNLLKWTVIIIFGGIFLIFKFFAELANETNK